jgi:hypothetical protein
MAKKAGKGKQLIGKRGVLERWLSGLRQRLARAVMRLKAASEVRILPLSASLRIES